VTAGIDQNTPRGEPSVLKNGRAKAVRFTTLAALCEALACQPGDLLRWEAEDPATE
jgi:putative transcriptional regulator